MPRKLIEYALSIAERASRSGIPRLVIEAPTGYGKTVGAPLIFSTFSKELSLPSFIHVLPLRAIVHDFYTCVLMNALTNSPYYRDRCRRNVLVLNEVKKALDEIDVGFNDIAYQMGETIVGEYVRKEPLFDARYIVTTLDSFVYNLFRVPVTEIFSVRKHYAIPRLRMFLSAVYLDEAHMIFEESYEESPMYTAAVKAINILNIFRVPLVLVSATLGRKVLDQIRRELSDVKVIRLGRDDREENNIAEVSDPDFVDAVKCIKWRTTTVRDRDMVSHILDNVERGYRVFLALDSIKRAVDSYVNVCKYVDSSRVVLIHGLMTRGDRIRSLDRIDKAKVLVATSVVEAGVDFSFDVLVSDGHRVSSLIQRCGRICRYVNESRCEEAKVTITEDHSSKLLLDFVKNVHNQDQEICWRLPFDTDSYIGYSHILDRVVPPKHDDHLGRYLEALVSPLFISSSTIEYILENVNYSLVRVGLVEAIVGDVEELNNVNYTDLLTKSIILPSYRVRELLQNRCIKGVVALYGDENVDKVEFVCSSTKVVNRRGDFDFKQYIGCQKKAAKTNRDLMNVVLLIDNNCYIPGIGVVGI